MVKFQPIIRKSGDSIRADDWNGIQKGLVEELLALEQKMDAMRSYIDKLTGLTILTGLESSIGISFALDQILNHLGESLSYGIGVMGLITIQWVPSVKGSSDICQFGISDYFDRLEYWSGASNGNTPVLDIIAEYEDGSREVIGEKLYINNSTDLSKVDGSNPYLEFLRAPSGWVWYKYEAKNTIPGKKVRHIKFSNQEASCVPRIGNVIHLRSKLRLLI